MAVVWELNGDTFYADSETADGTRCHLIVERLPAGGWDWSVWRRTDGNRIVRSGAAETAREAMQQAEEAIQN
jgi:hypothetical protein